MSVRLSSEAVVFERPGSLHLRQVELCSPDDSDLLVDVIATGISSGTEKLLWDGTMPAFPGLGYPLVPGYEAVGTVAQAGSNCSIPVGTQVFVPGANCYAGDLRGLFGATASRLVVKEQRVTAIPEIQPQQGVMLALAATAMHVLSHQFRQLNPQSVPTHSDLVAHAPQLIVGHGVLGRLLARLTVAIGAQSPTVWEIDKQRQQGAVGYDVLHAGDDDQHSRQHIVDVSGACGSHFNNLIGRLAKGGRLTLAGFYNDSVNFDFAPAFMREATIGISSEWTPHDLTLVLELLKAGAVSLDGLVSHEFRHDQAADAYPQAFSDPACLKTILNWSA